MVPKCKKSWFLAFSKGFRDGCPNATNVVFWGTTGLKTPKNHQNIDFLSYNDIFGVKSGLGSNFDFCTFLLWNQPIFKRKNRENVQNSFFFLISFKSFSRKSVTSISRLCSKKHVFGPKSQKKGTYHPAYLAGAYLAFQLLISDITSSVVFVAFVAFWGTTMLFFEKFMKNRNFFIPWSVL